MSEKERFVDTTGPKGPLFALRINTSANGGARPAVPLPRDAGPLVQQWAKAAVLAWLNDTVLPMLAQPQPPAAPQSGAATPLSARDLALLDSVFNIGGDLPLPRAKTPTPLPPLAPKDLARAGIKSGADLLTASPAVLKELFRRMNLSEGQLSLVADCVHNLKWHNDDLRKAAVLARQGPQGDQRTPKVTQPNQSTQQQQQQQYPQPTKTQQDSINDLRNSIDVGKLVINRAPRTLDASSALAPQRSYPPSVAGSDVLDINAERSVFANVMNPAASKIWEKCVKVYLIGRNQEKLTTMIDISNATDGSAVRSIILGYEKFHLSPRIYPKIALYSAKDAAGSYDSSQPLSDADLFKISQSIDMNQKHITLTTTHKTWIRIFGNGASSDFKEINTSFCGDGKSIREAIYEQFETPSDTRLIRRFQLSRVMNDGRADVEHVAVLDDDSLFDLAQSSVEGQIKSVKISVRRSSNAGMEDLNTFVLEKCIRVHSLVGESRSIDVSKCANGGTIREEIFKKFRLEGKQQIGFELYGLNSEGGLDTEINDTTLYDISKSQDYNKKSLLFLLKRQEFTERRTDLEAAINTAVRKSPSKSRIQPRSSRGSLDQERLSSDDYASPASTPPASPLNSLRLAWKGVTSQPAKPQIPPQLLSPRFEIPPSPSRSMAPSTRSSLLPLPTQPTLNHKDSFPYNSLRTAPSTVTFNDTQSIASTTYYRTPSQKARRRGSGSFLSNTSSRAFPGDFPGERPAVETIAQNLEVFFPKMQPLDTSDAMQGIVWYHESDVEGGSNGVPEVEEGIAEEDEEDEIYPLRSSRSSSNNNRTHVSSLRKADIAAKSSIHNGSLGRRAAGGGSLRYSTLSRSGSLGTLASRIPHSQSLPTSPLSPTSFTWEGKSGGSSSIGGGGVSATPTGPKKGGFRERLARLGSGGLFMTRDPGQSSEQPALSKQLSRQHLVSNLAQVGLLERIPPKSPSSTSVPSSPMESRNRLEFDAGAAESFRRNLATLIEGDSEDLVVVNKDGKQVENVMMDDDDDDNEAHLVSFDGSEVDVYTSSDGSGEKEDSAERREAVPDGVENVPLHIRWKGFVFKPNAASISGEDAAKKSLGSRYSFSPSLGLATDLSTIQGSKEEEEDEDQNISSPLLSPSAESMDIETPTPTAPSHNPIQLLVNTPSESGSSVTLTRPSLSEDSAPPAMKQEPPAPATAPINPDSPEIFTEDDISPPTRRPIRWIKGDMIGKGSFGSVFYGVNVVTKEVMAVKQIDVIPISRFRNKQEAGKNREKMIDCLRSEILLLNELNHENVVRYLGFDIENTLVSVFLEYVGGGSIASMIAKFGKFDEPITQSLLHQIINGLEYLHDRCIIHRDIKGANILVTMEGSVKISDFGISKKNELNRAYQINSKMEFVGSVFWMAPEMSGGGSASFLGYSAKIDVWAVGCVALEMLSGKHPWSGKGHMQAMWELRNGNAPPVPDGLSREAMVFLAHCFKMDPEERPTASRLFELCSFVHVDPWEFDFESWWEEKEDQYQLRCMMDNTSSLYSNDD